MDRVGRSCFLAIVDVLVYIEKAQLSELPVLESHASRCYVHKQPKEPTFIIAYIVPDLYIIYNLLIMIDT